MERSDTFSLGNDETETSSSLLIIAGLHLPERQAQASYIGWVVVPYCSTAFAARIISL